MFLMTKFKLNVDMNDIYYKPRKHRIVTYIFILLYIYNCITYLIQRAPGTPGDDIIEGLCRDFASLVTYFIK